MRADVTASHSGNNVVMCQRLRGWGRPSKEDLFPFFRKQFGMVCDI